MCFGPALVVAYVEGQTAERKRAAEEEAFGRQTPPLLHQAPYGPPNFTNMHPRIQHANAHFVPPFLSQMGDPLAARFSHAARGPVQQAYQPQPIYTYPSAYYPPQYPQPPR